MQGLPIEACPVCGERQFKTQPILWQELIDAWNLSPAEADYVNLQQGFSCVACKNNLRAMTLAAAITRAFRWEGTLERFCRTDEAIRRLKVAEINPSGQLTRFLRVLPNHGLYSFPQLDMQRMSFADGSLDIIIHSDTLEHVPDSRQALRESCRVLKPDGHLFYTVPVIIGRLTRKRDGLPPSYHGAPGTESDDLRVQTEYGADFWCEILEAGFREASLTALSFPASVAVHATK